MKNQQSLLIVIFLVPVFLREACAFQVMMEMSLEQLWKYKIVKVVTCGDIITVKILPQTDSM